MAFQRLCTDEGGSATRGSAAAARETISRIGDGTGKVMMTLSVALWSGNRLMPPTKRYRKCSGEKARTSHIQVMAARSFAFRGLSQGLVLEERLPNRNT